MGRHAGWNASCVLVLIGLCALAACIALTILDVVRNRELRKQLQQDESTVEILEIVGPVV